MKRIKINKPEYRTLRYPENNFVIVAISIVYFYILFATPKIRINQS